MKLIDLAVTFALVTIAPLPRVDAFSIPEGKEAIANMMKDPESVKFRGVFETREKDDETWIAICGEVNAKNSYGAYIGYQKFVAAGGINESEADFTYVVPQSDLEHALQWSMYQAFCDGIGFKGMTAASFYPRVTKGRMQDLINEIAVERRAITARRTGKITKEFEADIAKMKAERTKENWTRSPAGRAAINAASQERSRRITIGIRKGESIEVLRERERETQKRDQAAFDEAIAVWSKTHPNE